MSDQTALQKANVAALTIRSSNALEFTAEQRQMIRDTFANGASDSEFAMLMEIARARNLNPLMRQIWFVQRWDSQKNRMVWAPQVSIDGLRCIADRTGLYDGQDEPEFTYRGEPDYPSSARVKVYRKNIGRPFVGTAHWEEYVQKTKDGKVTKMWREKPHIMLGKTAEALALRKAFPEDMAGLYVPEEMPEGSGAPSAPALPRVDLQAAPTPRAPAESASPEELSAQLIKRCDEAMTMDDLKPVIREGGRVGKGSAREALVAAYTRAVNRIKTEERVRAAVEGAPPEPSLPQEEDGE